MMTLDITGALAHEHIAELRGAAARYNLAHEARRISRPDAQRVVRHSRLSRLATAMRGGSDYCPAACETC